MNLLAIIGAAALTFGAATAATAENYDLAVSGQITSIVALQNGAYVSVPAGIINVGDAFALQASFDTAEAVLTSTFDADPAVNIYYLPQATASARIGSYQAAFRFAFDGDASAQLWNDRDADATDAQSFSFFNYRFAPLEGYAFDVGGGSISESITTSAFDRTGSARTSDLITEIAPLSAFASKTFSYLLFNSDTNLFVILDGRVDSATLSVTSVPEPATWGLMLVGFGMVGAATRYRRKRTAVSFA